MINKSIIEHSVIPKEVSASLPGLQVPGDARRSRELEMTCQIVAGTEKQQKIHFEQIDSLQNNSFSFWYRNQSKMRNSSYEKNKRFIGVFAMYFPTFFQSRFLKEFRQSQVDLDSQVI